MNFDWQRMAIALPGILIGLTVHEFCHAFASFKLGDNTAKDQGRLTLNPLKHIDPLGFIFIIFAGFGWAKPVQFSPENLRNFRRDKAIIAAAGPASNFILAMVFVFLIKGYLALLHHADQTFNFELIALLEKLYDYNIVMIVLQAAAINFGLFVFNLLPIPPLDGSHIFFSGLNLRPETEHTIMKIGGPLLFLVIIIQNQTDISILPIGKLVNAMLSFFIPELR